MTKRTAPATVSDSDSSTFAEVPTVAASAKTPKVACQHGRQQRQCKDCGNGRASGGQSAHTAGADTIAKTAGLLELAVKASAITIASAQDAQTAVEASGQSVNMAGSSTSARSAVLLELGEKASVIITAVVANALFAEETGRRSVSTAGYSIPARSAMLLEQGELEFATTVATAQRARNVTAACCRPSGVVSTVAVPTSAESVGVLPSDKLQLK